MQLCRSVAPASDCACPGHAPVVRCARRVLVDDDDGALPFVDETDVIVEADSLRNGVAAVDAAATADDAAEEAAVLAHLKWSMSLQTTAEERIALQKKVDYDI